MYWMFPREDFETRRREVEAILDAIDAGAEHDQPVIEVFNKIDLWKDDAALNADPFADLPRKSDDSVCAVALSAQTGEGLDRLLHAIDRVMADKSVMLKVEAQPTDQRAVAWLHEHGAVLSETVDKQGVTTAHARLSPVVAGRFASQFPELAPNFEDAS